MSDQEPQVIRNVIRISDYDLAALTGLLSRYGVELELCPPHSDIPGSYWGDEEAGLVGNRLLARNDTPLHSVLHETSHYVCMDPDRRNGLHTNAGGDYDEENSVCYLQILLAECLTGVGWQRMCGDMDRWGYTFRLGSARAWFEHDAEDARKWLLAHNLITAANRPAFRLRIDTA